MFRNHFSMYNGVMLIIGHRGAAGEAPENTLEAIERGIRDDADMIEFDVQMTRDCIPILCHDPHLRRTHGKNIWISQHSYDKLCEIVGAYRPIPTLDQALKLCRGQVFVNIEIKTSRNISDTLNVIAKHYKSKKSQCEELLISSFKTKVLCEIRDNWPHAQLALLHTINPQKFILWHKRLNLAAVGFHRLHYNAFATKVAHDLGLFTYLYTVNRNDAVIRANRRDIDAVVTNYPARMVALAAKLNRDID